MIRIGICGYGNLGKGVEEAIKYSKDMELVAIFSRRDIQTAVPLIKMEDMEQYRKKNRCCNYVWGFCKGFAKSSSAICKNI